MVRLRRWSLPLMALAGAISAAAPARAYRTSADLPAFAGASAVRWVEPEIGLELATTGLPPGVTLVDAEFALADAMDVWNAVGCSSLRFTYLGATHEVAAPGDGRNTIMWIASGWEAAAFAPDAGGTTDAQYVRSSGSDVEVEIVEVDVYLNAERFAWTAGGEPVGDRVPIVNALVHELAHCAGLEHFCETDGTGGAPLCEETPGPRTPTTYPVYFGPEQRTLEPDDIEGLCFLYPAPRDPDPPPPLGTEGDPCAVDADCATLRCAASGYCTRTCDDVTPCLSGYTCVTNECRARSGVFGDHCDSGSECASGLCLDGQPGPTPICTRPCGSTALCPSGFECGEVEEDVVCKPRARPAAGCSIETTPGAPHASIGLLVLALAAAMRRRRRHLRTELCLFAAVLILGGCGDDGPSPGRGDAGDRDSGNAADAARLPEDAGTSPPPDAGQPDAGPCSPGERRTAPCGMCGLASQACSSAGTWDPPGACLSEGECAPGAVEMESTPRCGERARICDDTCAWRAWSTTTPDGECESGTSETITDAGCGTGGSRERTCSASCEWESGTCRDACGGAPRTSRPDAEEICIPAGPFFRGHTRAGLVGAGTPREVTLSAYYIDRYPATNERYMACVTAGACTEPSSDVDWHRQPARARRPVQFISWDQATSFCAFEGRRLPTEAEWEKAARGASPRMDGFVWGGDAYRCDILNSYYCGWRPDPSLYYVPVDWDVDGLPAARSPFGVELMIGGALEAVQDWYSDTYFTTPESLTDPRGPATGTIRVLRGADRMQERDYQYLVSWRNGASPSMPLYTMTVRCARSAP